jgi:hypothetical protein
MATAVGRVAVPDFVASGMRAVVHATSVKMDTGSHLGSCGSYCRLSTALAAAPQPPEDRKRPEPTRSELSEV